MGAEPFRFVDTKAMPWEPWHPQYPGTYAKTLVENKETGENLKVAFVPTGFTMPKHTRHHHGPTREFVYIMFGNVPYVEYDGPKTLKGKPINFKEGQLLDRPPRSIRGMSIDPVTTLGCFLLEWGTGPLSFNYIPFEGDLDALGTDYNPAHIGDTATQPWEPHPRVKGWKIKRLSMGGKSPTPGYHPVVIVHIPPGWQPEPGMKRSDVQPVRRWVYTLHGDTPLWAYPAADAKSGTRFDLKEGGWVEWTGPSVIGFEPGPASEIGAELLCVGHELA